MAVQQLARINRFAVVVADERTPPNDGRTNAGLRRVGLRSGPGFFFFTLTPTRKGAAPKNHADYRPNTGPLGAALKGCHSVLIDTGPILIFGFAAHERHAEMVTLDAVFCQKSFPEV